MNCLKNISLQIINDHFPGADNVPKVWDLILMNILILTNIFRWSLQRFNLREEPCGDPHSTMSEQTANSISALFCYCRASRV